MEENRQLEQWKRRHAARTKQPYFTRDELLSLSTTVAGYFQRSGRDTCRIACGPFVFYVGPTHIYEELVTGFWPNVEASCVKHSTT